MVTGFPLWRTVAVAYADTFRNLRAILRFAWLPFLIIVFVTKLYDVLSEWHDQIHFFEGAWSLYRDFFSWGRFIVESLCLAIYGLVIFGWQLRQGEAHKHPLAAGLDRRLIVFLSLIVAFFIIDEILWEVAWRIIEHYGVDEHITPATTDLLALAIFLLELVAVARFVFILPVAVLGEPNPSDRAWILGRGVWLWMFLLVGATYGVFVLIYETLFWMSVRMLTSSWWRDNSDVVMSEATGLIMTCILTAVSMLGIAVTATAICEAYRARATDFAGRDLVLPFMPGTKL